MRELPRDLGSQVQAAIREDVGTGDVTAGFVPANQLAHGRVITREAAVLCGRGWVDEVFRQIDDGVRIRWHAEDGGTDQSRAEPVRHRGKRSVDSHRRAGGAELPAASVCDCDGSASLCRSGCGHRLHDSRHAQDAAWPPHRAEVRGVLRWGEQSPHGSLRHGSREGEPHRSPRALLTQAVESARRHVPGLKVEVEVETMPELEEAIAARPDIIMLDNFSLAEMRKAVGVNREHGKPAKLEASGNVSLDNVREIAETGVDFISVGGITKHVRAVDLSMRLEFRSA